MKYVVCVPDGCADEPIDRAGRAHAARGGRPARPCRASPPGATWAGPRSSRRGCRRAATSATCRSSATTPPCTTRGGRPSRPPPSGLRLRARPGRLPLQPRHRRRRRHDGRLRRRPSLHRGGGRGHRRPRRPSWAGTRSSSTRASSTATSSWPPSRWADAECVPPHDLTDKPIVLPDGPGRARSCIEVMDASRGRPASGSTSPPTRSGSGARASSPRCPSFRERHGVAAGMVTAVDLVRGLGVLTDMRGRRRRRAPPAGTTPTTRASGTPPSTRWPTAPTSSSSTSRPPTRPATPATSRRRSRPSRTGTAASSPAWSRASTPWARGGCCCCPTTPRRCDLKTHTSDPVPYLLVDSAVDGPGGTYTEPGVADAVIVPGHQLMDRLLGHG